MRAPCLAGALVLLCLAGGCASTGPRDPVGWMEARGADFMDIFGIRLAVGPGLGIYARATQYVQLGFMLRGPSERGLPRPDGVSLRAVPCFMVGTIGRYGGAWFDSTREAMLPGWSTRELDRYYIEREVIAGFVPTHGDQDLWQWEFGGGLHLLVVGGEAEVRPFQAVDFVAGLFGYDPAGDDVPVDSSDSDLESGSGGEVVAES